MAVAAGRAMHGRDEKEKKMAVAACDHVQIYDIQWLRLGGSRIQMLIVYLQLCLV